MSKTPFPHGQCVYCDTPLLRVERRDNGHCCDGCARKLDREYHRQLLNASPDEWAVALNLSTWTLQ